MVYSIGTYELAEKFPFKCLITPFILPTIYILLQPETVVIHTWDST